MRNRARAISLALVGCLAAVLFGALAPPPARACSCAVTTFDEAVAQATAIFRGQVTAIVAPAGLNPTSVVVELRVDRVYKGALGSQVTIETGANSAACGFDFQAGQEYLIFAHGTPTGSLSTSLCARTAPVRLAGLDLRALGDGPSVANGFRAYWEAFGGEAVFGAPLTGEFQERGRVVQYFERARFEWQPGAWPERFDVLLGRIGSELLAGPEYEAARARLTASKAGCDFYPETGHNLCAGFRAFWQEFGGLTRFGYPITEEFADQETGRRVQWFERARLEWSPGSAPERYDVVVAPIGVAANQRCAYACRD